MTSGGDQRIWTPTADAPPAITESANPTGAQLLASFPPRPVTASWSATEPSRSEVLGRVLSAPLALDNPNSQQTRRLGILAVLSWSQMKIETTGRIWAEDRRPTPSGCWNTAPRQMRNGRNRCVGNTCANSIR